MQPIPRHRDWMPFVVFGASLLAAAILLVLCGGAMIAWQLAQGPFGPATPTGVSSSAASPIPSASPSPEPSAEPRPSPPAVSPADCLFGDWQEKSYVNTAGLTASIKPESYVCKGNDLRVYGDGYAMELTRIVPPVVGVPVAYR